MIGPKQQSGFTVIELLITLFVASAFLVAGFQLYNAIIKDGGLTRGESRASNVAYTYLRQYTLSATSPCVESTPLSNSSIVVQGISAVTVTVAITCPYNSSTPPLPDVSKIEVTVSYNNPQKTVRYATYVNN